MKTSECIEQSRKIGISKTITKKTVNKTVTMKTTKTIIRTTKTIIKTTKTIIEQQQ